MVAGGTLAPTGPGTATAAVAAPATEATLIADAAVEVARATDLGGPNGATGGFGTPVK